MRRILPRHVLCLCLVRADNLAPIVTMPIPDQDALPDWPFNFTVAPGTIVDPDAGDVVTCVPWVRGARALLASALPCPSGRPRLAQWCARVPRTTQS